MDEVNEWDWKWYWYLFLCILVYRIWCTHRRCCWGYMEMRHATDTDGLRESECQDGGSWLYVCMYGEDWSRGSGLVECSLDVGGWEKSKTYNNFTACQDLQLFAPAI